MSNSNTIYQASNSRLYRILRESSLDYYVWVEFLDTPGVEAMIMHSDNNRIVNKTH